MDVDLVITIASAAARMMTPLLLAALGELFAERSGILNLGIEGMMLMGAVGGFFVTYNTGSILFGLVAAMVVGGLMGFLMGIMAITLRTNQVVSGMAIWLLGYGLSGFLFRAAFRAAIEYPTITTLSEVKIPVLGAIPIIGPILFDQNVLVYLAILLVPICYLVLFKTNLGLRIRSVGENPLAAETVGIKVNRIRYLCTVLGGMLAGLGGVFLPMVMTGSFNEGMTGGRGFIAFATVIFGSWTPYGILFGALLFGGIDAVQMRLQMMTPWIPHQFLLMLPYLLTISALVVVKTKRGRMGQPASLGKSYERSER